MPTTYERFVAFRKTLGRTPPLERQTVRARGLRFAVFSSPPVEDAPPLLCINGGMLYDHSMLWPALSPLAADRQVILYDQRGRGASEAPPNPADARIEDDAADVGALRRALGVRQWDLLGHSWGGGIAMLATAGDPAGVRRLVTVDAVGATSAWMPELRAAVLARLEGDQRAAVERISEESLGQADATLHSTYSRAVYPAWFADPDMASRFTPPEALSPTGTAALARLRRDGYDWRALLKAVGVPAFLIHGEKDPLAATVAADTSYILPHGRSTVVPASGHMPFWEAPEKFFPLVVSFLRA